MKVCRRCGRNRRRSSFHACASAADGLQVYCKDCRRGIRRPADPQYYRDRYRQIGKFTKIQQKYGITKEQLSECLKNQKNKCAICRSRFSDQVKWHVDHDHATGLFRGLLCGPCNRGIGQLGDNPRTLRSAAEYLERDRVLAAKPKKK